MAIPEQGLNLGSVCDVRALVWLQEDELSGATAREEWDLADIVTRAAAVVACVLYVERANGNAGPLIASLPLAVRSILARLERSGLLEGAVRVECGPGIVWGGGH
jgi:hypothetical protein